jgi:hypothetical protein
MRSPLARFAFAAFAALAPGALLAGALLQSKPAPEWQADAWFNGNPGTLQAQRGKIVLLQFFQLWCPGSNSFSIPLFNRWYEKYGQRDDVVVVSLHSVFEGYEYQTPDRLREFVKEAGMLHHVGIDAYESPEQNTPITMQRYEAQGTPQIVIIDREGQVRYSHFGWFEPHPVEAFIERLFEEKPDKNRDASAAPAPPAPSGERPGGRRGRRGGG